VESNWVHSALRPPVGLLCQPRVIMIMEKLVEWLAGEPKYSEKTCPSGALSTTNPTCCPEANPGRRGGKPATNRLSYGTAFHILLIICLTFPFLVYYTVYRSYSKNKKAVCLRPHLLSSYWKLILPSWVGPSPDLLQCVLLHAENSSQTYIVFQLNTNNIIFTSLCVFIK
jgi:hypothetical protein